MNDLKLPAVINEELQGFIAHDRRVETVARTENYHVMTLEGYSGFSLGASRDSVAEEAHLESIPLIVDGTLQVRSADQSILYYTADLSPVLPEGWEGVVTQLNNHSPNNYGLTVFHPDHADEIQSVHVLSAEDFREPGTPQCDSILQSSFLPGTVVVCDREKAHQGQHQSISGGSFHSWTRGGSSASVPPYGFKNICRYCGAVDTGDATGENVCFFCNFWLDQHAAGGKRFIINGRHFRPGQGGFGGAKFIIERNDGTKWEGELFTQGEIPAFFKHLFPDNAKWAAESKRVI